jgi:hypothetical protein
MNAVSRPHREIPNPQVLDAAKQFRDGFSVMLAQPPLSGVLLPALHCASIALELYLKALSARDLEVPDSAFPGGAYIYAKASTQSHKLQELFDHAPTNIQQLIENGLSGTSRLSRHFYTVREALEAHNAMFMASRYPFEPSSELSNVDIGALGEMLALLDTAIQTATHRWVPQA